MVCPIDFSDPSFRAMETARELALQFSAEVYFVTVVPLVPNFPSLAPPCRSFEAYDSARLSSAKQSLKNIIDKKIPEHVIHHSVCLQGDPAEAIVKLAEKKNADLIVIATHGYSGWRHVVFGSVAEKVIRLSTCPVLVIRAYKKVQSEVA
ncbi:universal stress protein [candidate division CSSED10-310 bacterium]|uniref:Universal stress protein n=1 Tax=candidate division CSSED10-310 bacterium TaxID=2855610 RepID=A0ABV6YZP3_UNCC1